MAGSCLYKRNCRPPRSDISEAPSTPSTPRSTADTYCAWYSLSLAGGSSEAWLMSSGEECKHQPLYCKLRSDRSRTSLDKTHCPADRPFAVVQLATLSSSKNTGPSPSVNKASSVSTSLSELSREIPAKPTASVYGGVGQRNVTTLVGSQESKPQRTALGEHGQGERQ